MTAALNCAELLEFHSRLVAGDPLAHDSILCRFHSYLFEHIKHKFADNDADFVHDGAMNAILEFCLRPNMFDRRRGTSLKAYLLRATWCNAHNLIARERRLKQRERQVAKNNPEKTVAFDPAARDISIEEHNRHAAEVEIVLSLLKGRDREFFARYLEGVRDVATFARILQIEHLPFKQQRVVIKRTMDRIRTRLKRKGLWRGPAKKGPRAGRPKNRRS